MLKKVETHKAPAAIGPYSQAIQVGDFLYCSGQIPLIPGTGELVAGGVVEQSIQVMENLKQVLNAAGSDFESVVKTTIYLVDMGDFAAVNEQYGSYFGAVAPARATVQVAALPKNALVEIDAVAYLVR
ncbi:MAG: RidA family protein [Deltaproteobacteria bacterium]|nr:RidA family protein [Deltaproteobacteria bacterium]MCW9050098.1 RidA family protein [Deltaproteobacteria bacterium]